MARNNDNPTPKTRKRYCPAHPTAWNLDPNDTPFCTALPCPGHTTTQQQRLIADGMKWIDFQVREPEKSYYLNNAVLYLHYNHNETPTYNNNK